MAYEDIQKLQGAQARKASKKVLLCNDLSKIWNMLRAKQQQLVGGLNTEIRVDIVLDNAGFELFVDLLLAGWLLSTGMAHSVVLHPKSAPWFVFDVVPADFDALLDVLFEPRKLF
ncbi:hypothetical protein ACHAQH_003017 [Verticillium albo-atrum]